LPSFLTIFSPERKTHRRGKGGFIFFLIFQLGLEKRRKSHLYSNLLLAPRGAVRGTKKDRAFIARAGKTQRQLQYVREERGKRGVEKKKEEGGRGKKISPPGGEKKGRGMGKRGKESSAGRRVCQIQVSEKRRKKEKRKGRGRRERRKGKSKPIFAILSISSESITKKKEKHQKGRRKGRSRHLLPRPMSPEEKKKEKRKENVAHTFTPITQVIGKCEKNIGKKKRGESTAFPPFLSNARIGGRKEKREGGKGKAITRFRPYGRPIRWGEKKKIKKKRGEGSRRTGVWRDPCWAPKKRKKEKKPQGGKKRKGR